ncbi:MAG: phosphatidylglycerophosphatase A [Planctomycetota bacterium]
MTATTRPLQAHPTQPRATGWKLQTPNALVAARLALAAITIVYLSTWTPGRPEVLSGAAVLFILAALTDALDGYLARKWNAVTTLGRIMDPVADKVLVLGVLIVLAGPSFTRDGAAIAGFTPLMVVAIVARELVVTSVRAAAETSGLRFGATAVGKVKMIVQSAAIPLILLALAQSSATTGAITPLTRALVDTLAWLTTLVTAWSLFPYLFNVWDAFTGGQYQPSPTTPDQRQTHSAARALTVHGFGLMRPFPGTWGSLPPVLLAAALTAGSYTQTDASPEKLAVYYTALAALFAWGCWACLSKGHIAEAVFNKKDPGPVVADEVAGMCLTLVALPISLADPWYVAAAWLLGAFVAFRVFDIIKLPPAAQLQRLPGGLGILVDDLFAGLYALATIQVIAAFIA